MTQEELVRRINEAAERGDQALNLSGEGITSLPAV